MRFERKYRIELLDRSIVEQLVRFHPAGFRKAFPDRRVNNIYLDTPDLSSFNDNVAGVSERQKYRIRWYGERFDRIEKPTFEIKSKQNQLGVKFSTKLPDFELSTIQSVIPLLQTSSMKSGSLRPALVNSYRRSYFTTADEKFRITIDWEMRFGMFQQKLEFLPYRDANSIILELKYDAIFEKEADRITQHIPFRLTKNSKYVNGICCIMGL